MTSIQIVAVETGKRLDSFLAEAGEGLTRSAIQKLMEQGQVLHNGKAVRKNEKTIAGDTYLLCLPDPEPLDIKPENIPLDVVFEDRDVIVINKPVGMVVHPAPGHPDGTLVNALLYHCGDSLSGINGVMRPGIVHRIDRDTSGLIVVAKNDAAHISLAGQLKDHSLSRTYEAVITGGLRQDEGVIDAPIARHPVDRKKMCVPQRDGRPSVTRWKVLKRYSGYTHIQCKLETGRTHQIRVHMAHIGHPLLGDVVYGAKKPYPGLAGQCLHARCLEFVHPSTGQLIRVECPLPDWFEAVLHKLG